MKIIISDPITEEYCCKAVGETVELSRTYKIIIAPDGNEKWIKDKTLCPKMDYCQNKGNWECPENVYAVLSPEAQENIQDLLRRGMKVDHRS